MSELALDGPNKDEVPSTTRLHPSLLAQRLEQFPCETKAGEACAVNIWMKTGGNGVETGSIRVGGHACPLQRVLMR